MSKTTISLYAGFDDVYRLPKLVRRAGLSHRLAVVQETLPARPDGHVLRCRSVGPAGRLRRSICPRRPRYGSQPSRCARREPSPADEVPLQQFTAAQQARRPDDRDPAEYLMVRDAGTIDLLHRHRVLDGGRAVRPPTPTATRMRSTRWRIWPRGCAATSSRPKLPPAGRWRIRSKCCRKPRSDSCRHTTERGSPRVIGGGGWIRTSVGEASGFTVRPL